jgi:hypothetical protein
MRHFLDALQDFQAASAALAFQRIGGIGNKLELVQNELRDDYGSVEKLGVGDIGDAAVDDHAGV